MSAKTNSVQIGQINRVAIEATAPSGIIVIDLIRIKRLVLGFVKNNWLNLLIFVLFIYLILTKMEAVTISFGDSAAIGKAQNVSEKVNLKQKNLKQKSNTEASLIAASLSDDNGDPSVGVVEVLPKLPTKPVKSAYANGGNDANLFNNVSIFVSPEQIGRAHV